MEQQTRYDLGKREEDGRYPVTVDSVPVGTVHRRHGSWYATMPGRQILIRFTDRHAAAAHLVTMTDAGIRPTIPAPADTPASGTAPFDATPAGIASQTYRHLLPDLRLTLPNLVRSVEAMARLDQLGWTPLEGYPGADQPWRMECRLCGWQGRRFWSHLRGRNGDGIPRPANRHPGCIPVEKISAQLIHLAADRLSECRCDFQHPMEISYALSVLANMNDALSETSPVAPILYARPLLEPCPASARRANVLRIAYNRRTAALRSIR
ncbi:hypothetical protein ACPCAE_33260 [Streptomyces cinereoruber]|uniref:hypothetical protein n=1 Tax=Streptomyces cinereoruber TaxID=67260 RepID=UPI003C2F12AD